MFIYVCVYNTYLYVIYLEFVIYVAEKLTLRAQPHKHYLILFEMHTRFRIAPSQ